MSAMKVYVKAKSKNDINARLDAGETVTGRNYSIFGDGGDYDLDGWLPAGTIICTYTKLGSDGYSPVGRYWYKWNGSRCE